LPNTRSTELASAKKTTKKATTTRPNPSAARGFVARSRRLIYAMLRTSSAASASAAVARPQPLVLPLSLTNRTLPRL
jgi:hypothetical protein